VAFDAACSPTAVAVVPHKYLLQCSATGALLARVSPTEQIAPMGMPGTQADICQAGVCTGSNPVTCTGWTSATALECVIRDGYMLEPDAGCTLPLTIDPKGYPE